VSSGSQGLSSGIQASTRLGQMNRSISDFDGKSTGADYHGNNDSFCHTNYSDDQTLSKQNIFNLLGEFQNELVGQTRVHKKLKK